MAYNGNSDFSDNYSAGGTQGTAPSLTLSAHDGVVDLPDASYVRDADISREGVDLVLEGPQGTIVIEGYFAVQPAPDLISPDGAHLTPNLVDSFLSSGSEYANAGSANDASPIGSISEVTGSATVTRVDGTVEPITLGTPIYQGDVVETSGNGAANIVFIDETEFAVSEDARLAIDEYVYDPATQSGTQNFSVLKGVFVFTSGMIGRDDPDDVQIETPVGSIGIRGTIIAGNVTNGEITVVEGAIVLTDFGGNQVTLANQFETARFNVGGGVENIGTLSASDVAGKFSSISNVAPSLFSSIGDAANDSGGGKSGSSSSESESKGESGENNSESGKDASSSEGGEGATEGKATATESGEAKAAAPAETKAAEAPAEAAKAPATAPQTVQAQAGKGGFGSAAGTTTTTGDGPAHGPAAGDTRAAKGPAPAPLDTTANKTPAPTPTSEPIRAPLTTVITTTTTNDSSTDSTTNSTPTAPNATFVTHSYTEIVDGVTPPSLTILAKIQVAAGSNVSLSDFTFTNVPSAFTGANLRVVADSTANVFKIVADNTTPVRNGLDFDRITDLMEQTANLNITVRGETLNLGHQIRTNITDVNEGPSFKPSANASYGTDAQAYESFTDDFIDGVAVEHFRASDATKWEFDFRPLFADPDFGRDSGANALASGAQGNIAEQLTYKLSASTLSILNSYLGTDIVAIRDFSGTAINMSTGEFDGTLYIEFSNSLSAGFDFNLDVQAIDSANNASGYQSFDFNVVNSSVFIGTDVPQNFTTGNDTIAINPGVGISSGGFAINSSNNEVFFGNTNDSDITIGASRTGNTLHMGDGNDSMTIDTGANNNIVIGGRGDDTLNIRGANNNVYGGEGDDTFILDIASNNALLDNTTHGLSHAATDSLYDGGIDNLHLPLASTGGNATGHGDSLKFLATSGQTVDFSLFSEKIHNIENINLQNTYADTITLTRQDVINMTDARNTLIIDLDNGPNDLLNFNTEGSTFTQGQDVTVDSTIYNSFSDGSVTLLINDAAANSTNVTGLGLPV